MSKDAPLCIRHRWQSADGRVNPGDPGLPARARDLDSLFDQATAPLPNRKVTYKLRRPESLVVTAEAGPGLSYIRYDAGPQGVRGFLIATTGPWPRRSAAW